MPFVELVVCDHDAIVTSDNYLDRPCAKRRASNLIAFSGNRSRRSGVVSHSFEDKTLCTVIFLQDSQAVRSDSSLR
jgi:hypothetical protein